MTKKVSMATLSTNCNSCGFGLVLKQQSEKFWKLNLEIEFYEKMIAIYELV